MRLLLRWRAHPLRCVRERAGTNIGHQIRKVYEPRLYPKNPTEAVFARYLGPPENRTGVCSYGFEANSLHEDRLRALEAAYAALGRCAACAAQVCTRQA